MAASACNDDTNQWPCDYHDGRTTRDGLRRCAIARRGAAQWPHWLAACKEQLEATSHDRRSISRRRGRYMHLNGLGVETNHAKALEFYRLP